MSEIRIDPDAVVSIDLRVDVPRSPHEALGGVKLLGYVIDKARATIAGTLGPYTYYDDFRDRILFNALDVGREEFLSVIRNAWTTHLYSNCQALVDLRESRENVPALSDRTFMSHAQGTDIDTAVLRWINDTLQTPQSVVNKINAEVEALPPDAK